MTLIKVGYSKLQMESRDMVALDVAPLPVTVGDGDRKSLQVEGLDVHRMNKGSGLASVTASSWGCVIVTLSLFYVYLSTYDGIIKRWIGEGNPMLVVFLVLHCALFLRFFTVRRDPGFLDEVANRPQSASEGADNLPLRYCQYCNMYQPRRTRHCKQCERCILTFDHHCFWIGGCVGERNTFAFMQMLCLFSITLTWYYPLLCSTFVHARGPFNYVYDNGFRILLFVILFAFWLLVVGLLFYHLFLACTAQTTWENIRRHSIDYLKDFPREVLPFSKGGAFENIQEICSRGNQDYIRWQFTWTPGEPIPFSWFENEYWSCC